TICIVFFPVVLLYGPAKHLFTPLALAVVFAMMASYVLSRTLVPTLARMLMAKEAIDHGDRPPRGIWQRFNRGRDAIFDRFQGAYARLLQVVLARRGFAIAIGGAMIGVTLFLARSIGTDFFPEVDAGQMRLHVRAPIGMRIEDAEKVIGEVEARIR